MNHGSVKSGCNSNSRYLARIRPFSTNIQERREILKAQNDPLLFKALTLTSLTHLPKLRVVTWVKLPLPGCNSSQNITRTHHPRCEPMEKRWYEVIPWLISSHIWLGKTWVSQCDYLLWNTVFQLVPGVAHQPQQFVCHLYMFTKQACVKEKHWVTSWDYISYYEIWFNYIELFLSQKVNLNKFERRAATGHSSPTGTQMFPFSRYTWRCLEVHSFFSSRSSSSYIWLVLRKQWKTPVWSHFCVYI